MVHQQALAGGDGDRGRAGVGLQAAGVAEPGAVIADLAQHPGAGERADAGEAGQDLRVWVLVEGGNLLFKADIASDTPECVYLEGVYVDPALRQQGLGLRCLSQLGRELLERTKVVSALVNEQNLAAQALFQKAGYKLRGLYDTVFLEQRH